MCTDRERIALEFAERLATSHESIDDGFMADMRRHFSDAELVELGLVTGSFLMLGRLHFAFGIAPTSGDLHTVLRLADGSLDGRPS